MKFKILGTIANIEIIAVNTSIRILPRLNKLYGKARWRKLKGIATITLDDGTVCQAELHWYEAHGLGKKEIKIKTFL